MNKFCNKACAALVEYEKEARLRDLVGGFSGKHSMPSIAGKYGVSMEEMKKHWNCTDRILGKDPYENFPNYLLREGK